MRSRFKRSTGKRADEPRLLENLFEARDRARKTAEPDEKPEVSSMIKKRAVDQPADPVEDAPSQDVDTLARLRQAKKRAKRDGPDENS